MRAGIPRVYMLFTFVELVIFTASCLRNDVRLVAAFFILLFVGILLFYGREVRVEGNKIILEWGLLFRYRQEIVSTEILDLVDVPSNRYFVFAKYLPEVLLVPAGMVLGGILLLLSGTKYGWSGLGWMLVGAIELVNYATSPEKKKAGTVAILLITGIITLIAYLIKSEMVVPLALFGFSIAAIFWEGGPVTGNLLLLFTERGIYSVTYASKSELKRLISALGDVNEG